MRDAHPPVLYEPLAAFNRVTPRPRGAIVLRPITALDEPPDPDGRILGRFEGGDARPIGYLWLLDRHPSGQVLAMHADAMIRVFTTRAGVWEAATGKLIWEPEDTLALCWSPDGRQVFLVRERYEHSPDHPAMALTPLQSDYTFSLEQRTWPDKALIQRGEIAPPTGFPNAVVSSPRGDLAAVRWIEQDCTGIVFVALAPGRVEQLPAAGFRTDGNLVTMPIFSLDGRYLAMSCGAGSLPDRSRLGSVWIYDVDAGLAHAIEVDYEIPPDWPLGAWDDWLGEPRFLSDHELVVRLPTGTNQHFNLRNLEHGTR